LERKIYVVDALHNVFAERFTARVAAMHAGDEFDERSDVVPLIDANAIEKVRRHDSDVVSNGGGVLVGRAPPRRGAVLATDGSFRCGAAGLAARDVTFGPSRPRDLVRGRLALAASSKRASAARVPATGSMKLKVKYVCLAGLG
jgi:hypothetical protein